MGLEIQSATLTHFLSGPKMRMQDREQYILESLSVSSDPTPLTPVYQFQRNKKEQVSGFNHESNIFLHPSSNFKAELFVDWH